MRAARDRALAALRPAVLAAPTTAFASAPIGAASAGAAASATAAAPTTSAAPAPIGAAPAPSAALAAPPAARVTAASDRPRARPAAAAGPAAPSDTEAASALAERLRADPFATLDPPLRAATGLLLRLAPVTQAGQRLPAPVPRHHCDALLLLHAELAALPPAEAAPLARQVLAR